MVRSMSRTASEAMGTPQTHGAVGGELTCLYWSSGGIAVVSTNLAMHVQDSRLMAKLCSKTLQMGGFALQPPAMQLTDCCPACAVPHPHLLLCPAAPHLIAVGPMLMRMAGGPAETPASNGPLVLLSLSSPFDAASLAARQHPQLPPNNSTPERHPPDHFAADHTPNSGRRGAPAAALQLGLTANAVQQQLLAAAPKLQQLQQGMEQQGSGSLSHGGSMDGTASGGPASECQHGAANLVVPADAVPLAHACRVLALVLLAIYLCCNVH